MNLKVSFQSKEKLAQFTDALIELNYEANNLTLYFNDLSYKDYQYVQNLAKQFGAIVLLDYRDIRF